MTIADYWGYKNNNDDKGMSLVVVNTKKGDVLLNTTASLMHLIPLETSSIIDLFQDRDKQMYSLKKRRAFFNRYIKHGYDKTMNKCIKRKITVKRQILNIKTFAKKIIHNGNDI